MKNFFLLFICLMSLRALAQPVPTGNLTANWIESEKDFYILNDNTLPDDVNQVNRAQMQPKLYNQNVSYKWIDGAFAERAVTIKNYLGIDGFFSFPVTTIKYTPDGSVARYSLAGSFIEQVSPPNAALALDLAASKIQNVSPIFPKPLNYSFVPQLTISQLDSIYHAGYTVVNHFPEYLEITGADQKIIFDNQSKTRSYLLNESGSKIASLKTDYFTEDEQYVYKTRSLTQNFITLVSGLCVIQAKEISYSGYNIGMTGSYNYFLSNLPEPGPSLQRDLVSVFPNPTTSSFILNVADNKYMPENVKLYDINGREIPFTTSSDILGNLAIHPQGVTSNLLILSYRLNNVQYTQKILKF